MYSLQNIIAAIIAVIFYLSCITAEDQKAKNICTICVCTKLDPNFYIDCDRREIKELFTAEDWNNTLEDKENKEKYNTSNLIKFEFSENLLTSIPRFPAVNISLLNLAYNRISSIDNSAFAELTHLDWLDLSGNNLTTVSIPESSFFGKFNGSQFYFPLSLKHLNLSHNRIHTLGKDLFDHMPNLLTLDLRHNPLTVLGGSTSSALSSLLNIEVLILRSTSIKDMPAGMLHALQKLKALDIADNSYTEVPEEISYARNLELLEISGNKITELNQRSFVGLDNLQDLYINNMNSLKFISTATFGPLKKLAKIEITHNRHLYEISDAAFFGMVNATAEWKLAEMHLNDNGLTHLDQELAAWEYVDYIDIQNNPFMCNCRIEWMAKVLIDRIRRTTPLLVNDIKCSEPQEMKGKSLVALSIEPSVFIRCDAGERDINGELNRPPQDTSYQTAGVTILVIGIMLILIGVSILGFIFVKRRAIALALLNHQQIRYERADTDEIEYSNGRFRDKQ